MPFISYAQNYEDVVLWRALREVEGGFYVDVGAADPEEFSVTCAFYERGWSGINLEPLDEYFAKLRQARPRDKNLKVAAGRETGVRTFFALPSGWSTLDPQLSARHQAGELPAQEVVVTVLTLTKILEDCGLRTIHFLKIDVEGAEAEVLEGLNLERVRPWIIVIKATKPFSTVSTRSEWEYLVTGHRYGFAYFDGLNCFYVAEEIPGLKERLATPPNVFDDFVRWAEWSNGQKAATLEQELVGVREQAQGLGAALQAEKNHSANLQIALQVEKNYSANLENALQAEQALVANLNNVWQVRLDNLNASIRHLESQLAAPSIDRALGGAVSRLRERGNRLTGGGIRALVKRALTPLLRPCLAFAARHPREDSVAPTATASTDISSLEPKGESLPPEDPILATLPVSARSTYLNLQSAMSNGGTTTGTTGCLSHTTEKRPAAPN
jgi:FkbM family methyltransferase